jgi:hypothetical protein
MSPVAADRLTCTTSVEVKIAYHASELRTAQQVQWGCEDAPGAGEREKALFCQLLRHIHDEPRQKDMGHVVQRKRRDGAQTFCTDGLVTQEVPRGPRRQRLGYETPKTPSQ